MVQIKHMRYNGSDIFKVHFNSRVSEMDGDRQDVCVKLGIPARV
jgi:hypothetical protein